MKRHPSRPFFFSVCLTLLFGVFASAPAFAAHPALWRASDADTTVYFFGTVHIMNKDTRWHFPALDKALAASKELYIEAADADPATVQPLVLQYGLDPAHPLTAKLDKADNALLQEAASEMGLPGGAAALDMMRPWLAGLTIAVAPILKAGFDPNLGVDKQLQAEFEKAGKPVKGLETSREQIMMIAQLPEALQLDLLRQTLRDYKDAMSELHAIVSAWESGNIAKISALVDRRMKRESPELYQTLIVKRNDAWAKQIADMMKTTPGTIFIAVGTGHLVGPDRLQVQLRKLGIDATRVDE